MTNTITAKAFAAVSSLAFSAVLLAMAIAPATTNALGTATIA